MFNGGSEEDIPLRHVTAVRYETYHRWVLGIILVLVGLAIAFGGHSVGSFIGGALIAAIGVLFVMGTPTVTVVTASGEKEIMTGYPWNKQEPQEFVKALKNQLFDGSAAKS